uniref:DPH-type MB domain-containing protein n=1 Tax=Oryza brachyantha TaxID=4533 RepID=J3MGI3_ORYBR
MSAYDEVEIEDMEWNAELGGEEIARCPSCSLSITVVYNEEELTDGKEPPPKPAPRPVAVA